MARTKENAGATAHGAAAHGAMGRRPGRGHGRGPAGRGAAGLQSLSLAASAAVPGGGRELIGNHREEGIIIMKAVVSVIGRDSVGIIAKVSAGCAESGANILDISQTVLNEYFTMIMIVDIKALTVPFNDFVDRMSALGRREGLEIHAMHEDIFNSMHRI